jgi:hypothetical protein
MFPAPRELPSYFLLPNTSIPIHLKPLYMLSPLGTQFHSSCSLSQALLTMTPYYLEHMITFGQKPGPHSLPAPGI